MDNLVLSFEKCAKGECLVFQGAQVEPSLKIVNLTFYKYPGIFLPMTRHYIAESSLKFYNRKDYLKYVIEIEGYKLL